MGLKEWLWLDWILFGARAGFKHPLVVSTIPKEAIHFFGKTLRQALIELYLESFACLALEGLIQDKLFWQNQIPTFVEAQIIELLLCQIMSLVRKLSSPVSAQFSNSSMTHQQMDFQALCES